MRPTCPQCGVSHVKSGVCAGIPRKRETNSATEAQWTVPAGVWPRLGDIVLFHVTSAAIFFCLLRAVVYGDPPSWIHHFVFLRVRHFVRLVSAMGGLCVGKIAVGGAYGATQ